MFVMLNDGGVPPPDVSLSAAQRILIQRTLLFELMSQGLACCLLTGAEFRDSKVCPPKRSITSG